MVTFVGSFLDTYPGNYTTANIPMVAGRYHFCILYKAKSAACSYPCIHGGGSRYIYV